MDTQPQVQREPVEGPVTDLTFRGIVYLVLYHFAEAILHVDRPAKRGSELDIFGRAPAHPCRTAPGIYESFEVVALVGGEAGIDVEGDPPGDILAEGERICQRPGFLVLAQVNSVIDVVRRCCNREQQTQEDGNSHDEIASASLTKASGAICSALVLLSTPTVSSSSNFASRT